MCVRRHGVLFIQTLSGALCHVKRPQNACIQSDGRHWLPCAAVPEQLSTFHHAKRSTKVCNQGEAKGMKPMKCLPEENEQFLEWLIKTMRPQL